VGWVTGDYSLNAQILQAITRWQHRLLWHKVCRLMVGICVLSVRSLFVFFCLCCAVDCDSNSWSTDRRVGQ